MRASTVVAMYPLNVGVRGLGDEPDIDMVELWFAASNLSTNICEISCSRVRRGVMFRRGVIVRSSRREVSVRGASF